MIANRSDIPRLQSEFYKNQLHKVVRWLFMAVTIMILLIIAIVYFILFQPIQTYYANTTEGRILPMPPVILEQTRT